MALDCSIFEALLPFDHSILHHAWLVHIGVDIVHNGVHPAPVTVHDHTM